VANFSRLITTTKGHAFIASVLEGTVSTAPPSPFTRIVTSSAVYTPAQLEGLATLTDIQQETVVSDIVRLNATTIQIHGGIDNRDVSVGYRLNAAGVFFRDPADGEEYLFGVSIHVPTNDEPNADFIMPFNGSTTTGIIFDFIAGVGNADNFSLEVNPAASVTVIQLENALRRLIELSDANIPMTGTRLQYHILGAPIPLHIVDAFVNSPSIGTQPAILNNNEYKVPASLQKYTN